MKKNNIFYITFYFPKSYILKINNTNKKIITLTIKYDFKKTVDYTTIITELKTKVFNTKNHEKIINNLFDYIKGKDILYMIEKKDDINQKGLIETRALFNENDFEEYATEIKNYQ